MVDSKAPCQCFVSASASRLWLDFILSSPLRLSTVNSTDTVGGRIHSFLNAICDTPRVFEDLSALWCLFELPPWQPWVRCISRRGWWLSLLLSKNFSRLETNIWPNLMLLDRGYWRIGPSNIDYLPVIPIWITSSDETLLLASWAGMFHSSNLLDTLNGTPGLRSIITVTFKTADII